MSVYIKTPRVRQAIARIADWRNSAKSQAAMHLWPLIALLEKGVNSRSFTAFSEDDDRQFWDKYFRFPGETRNKRSGDSFEDGYYIEPLTATTKPSDYPHRGPSTIRVRTFKNSWQAAATTPDGNDWKLSENYVDIFIDRVLRRQDRVVLIPGFDVAIWLFRETEFQDGFSCEALLKKLQDLLRFSGSDFAKLFNSEIPPTESVFEGDRPSGESLRKQILEALVPDNPIPAARPGLMKTDERAASVLPEDDQILTEVRRLLSISSAGIILRGTAGTGKTWYAKQIAQHLAAKPEHIFEVQFHPSFGYEDFVEGYRPSKKSRSGFELVDRIFMDACKMAAAITTPVVLVIDEINRGDPSRILGELLTYIEPDYRNISFIRPFSGTKAKIPSNLVVIGTMNNFDKSISQLDLALIRRFDHIDITPSSETVEGFLKDRITQSQSDTLVKWFETLQGQLPPESGGIGHTYFKDVRHPEDIKTIWKYRMRPYCAQLLELDPDRLENVDRAFEAMFSRLVAST